MKIVADEKIPFLRGVLDSYARMVYLPGNEISNSDLRDTDALLTRSVTVCNEQILKNTGVKLIASATIGDDHIDKDYCTRNNIRWSTAKGCNATAVVQYVTSGMLALAEKNQMKLSGMTLGIVGVGSIGKKVKQVAEVLGMKVLLNDPPREKAEGPESFTSIDEIKDKADIITFHVPLNTSGVDKTFHLADEDFFRGLKKKIILINTSRGKVVKTQALKTAIADGVVQNTILDVWENEPMIDRDLLDLVDIATPHIAGYSLEGKATGTSMIVNEVCRCFDLPILNWFPELTLHGNKIGIDGKNMNDQEIVYNALNSSCDILAHDIALRSSPDKFSEIRDNYPFRRENKAYMIEYKNCSFRAINMLNKLEFNLKS